MPIKVTFTINTVPNIVQDIVILLMPVEQIWGLQAARAQKLRLYTTFGVGAL